jgi:Tfp pilus assembly protein PilZ
MERRSSSRTHIDETTIFTKDGIFTAMLENISMGGLFLRTNKPIQVGEMIEITIPLPSPVPDGPKKKIVVDAVAVRVEEHGIAFRFHEVNDDIYNALLYLTDPPRALTKGSEDRG